MPSFLMPCETSIHWSSATALALQLPGAALFPLLPLMPPSTRKPRSFLVARLLPLTPVSARGAKVLLKVFASVEHPTATSDSHSKNCACVSPTVTGGSAASLASEEASPTMLARREQQLVRREHPPDWLHDTLADPSRPWWSPAAGVVARTTIIKLWVACGVLHVLCAE